MDDVILTKDTVEIAAGKEDGTTASRTADKRFFIEMQSNPCNVGNLGTTAKTELSDAVCGAGSRANGTNHQNTRRPHTKLRFQ